MSEPGHQAFHEQFVRFQGSLYGYIAMLVGHRADAEEVFSRVSLILWEKWEQFDPTRHFLPWARAVAFNEARNFRRARRRSHTELTAEVIEQLAATRERHDEVFEDRMMALQECLDGLAEDERNLLEVCYSKRTSIKEAAAALSTTPGALYMRLHRIRQFLHECIDCRLASGDSTI